MTPAVRLLKLLRTSQPFNAIATRLVRGALSMSGLRSEWIIRHLHRMGPVAARLPNGKVLRLWSLADDWVSNQVFWRGWTGYEPETAPLFLRLASRARVTLDVGAYVGYYALLAAHANPSGRVFAFEPHPLIHERLCANARRNDVSNVDCVRAAVGAVSGMTTFYARPDGLPTSSSLSREFMQGCAEAQPFEVPLVSVDTFVQEARLSGVDLLKIDTETTEADVLRGARRTLERDRPFVVCEVLAGRGVERALEDVLRPMRYRYRLLTPSGPEPRGRIEGHPSWLNYLFVPDDRDDPA